jgi:hypothetical protein
VPGFPIRTPWDHSSVDSSPRPIAASHVLHRLLVPRHPPFALDNLTTKMLASTMQISTNNQPTTRYTPHQHRPPDRPPIHRPTDPQATSWFAGPGSTWHTQDNTPPQAGLFPQDSTGCPPPPAPETNPPLQPATAGVLEGSANADQRLRQCLRHPSTPTRHSRAAGSLPPPTQGKGAP